MRPGDEPDIDYLQDSASTDSTITNLLEYTDDSHGITWKFGIILN